MQRNKTGGKWQREEYQVNWPRSVRWLCNKQLQVMVWSFSIIINNWNNLNDIKGFYKRSGQEGEDQRQPFPMCHDRNYHGRGRSEENQPPDPFVFFCLFHQFWLGFNKRCKNKAGKLNQKMWFIKYNLLRDQKRKSEKEDICSFLFPPAQPLNGIHKWFYPTRRKISLSLFLLFLLAAQQGNIF